ncbi:MAG: NAD(P)-dependent alcohol dehydrogenase, partial [Candidatus Kariarchaeaceae archaeon]
KANEVLIKIHAATVTLGDCELRSMKFQVWWIRPLVRLGFGVFRPRRHILGQELAGTIEAVGEDVTKFKVGDEVFGPTGLGLGAYAEYKTLKETGAIIKKPKNMTFEETATIPTGGLNSLHFLRKANIQSGQRVLINGAGGSIGTYGVQIAKNYRAEVTAVDHADKFDMLKSIGADHVIDYMTADFTRNGETYDVIFDIVGKSPYRRSMRSLNKNGVYLLGNPKFNQMIRGKLTNRSSKTVISSFAADDIKDLEYLKQQIEEGKLKSIIDRSYPLEETKEAHVYVETGQKQGNVVINIVDEK